MVKRVNIIVTDEMHRALKIKLAEDGAILSDWFRERVIEYVGKIPAPKGKHRKGKEG